MKKLKALMAFLAFFGFITLNKPALASTTIYLDSSILQKPLLLFSNQEQGTSLPILNFSIGNNFSFNSLAPVKIIAEATQSASPSASPSAKLKPKLIINTDIASRSASAAANIVKTIRGALSADKLFEMVNEYRAKLGLSAFQKDDRVCSLAQSRAPEVGEEIDNGHMHSGLKARNIPFWNTENIISMNSVEGAFNWWINDFIHRKAIEGDYKYSCVACSGNSCAEEFTNLAPK